MSGAADAGRLYELRPEVDNLVDGTYYLMMNVGEAVFHEKLIITGK